MSKLVVLNLGEGNFEIGFPVTLEIGEDGARPSMVIQGKLPSSPEILRHYENWQSAYHQLGLPFRIRRKETQIKNCSIIQDCRNAALVLSNSLNDWLNSEQFRVVKEGILINLHRSQEIRVLIQTEDINIIRLPWHLWELFLYYPKAEIAFSPSEYKKIEKIPPKSKKDKIKILAILGDTLDINVRQDLDLIKQRLPDAYIQLMTNPQRHQLSEQLWEKDWDIFFFAGHSSSEAKDEKAQIYISQTESLTIEELRFALKRVIAQSLKLAIFNSCDGLGLAQELEDLQLPATVVMREPIPDEAAQKFLEYFLKAFGEDGKSLYTSVREARERLHGLEDKFPCASWLPVICQNPAAPNLTWQKLGGLLPCPYRGLSAFQEVDASVFFGREAFTEQLVEAVKKKPLVAVIGPSGSGKSSVVFAGLIPRLRIEATHGLPLQIASFRPGKSPFEALAAALISVGKLPMSYIDQWSTELELVKELQQSNCVLYRIIESIVQRGNGSRLLLVIDQFEEIYTLCPAEERQVFLDGLLNAVNIAPGFTLTLTLRSDFFGQALSYEPLGKVLQQYRPELLIPMNREELERAIALPAKEMNVQLEEGLTTRVLDDVSDQPGNLPLLEFALTQLWEKQRDGLLTHKAYKEIGGVEKALANHAEAVYAQLSESDRIRAQRVFIQLVSPGEGTEDTQRLATRDEVGEDNWDFVTHLASARLVVTNYNSSADEETVEIVHEALIRNWGRLSQWMNTDGAFRTWQQQLRAAMRQWETSGKDEGALLRGVPLAEAESWLQSRPVEVSQAEQVFIQLSLELWDRERKERERRWRWTILGLAGGLMAVSILAGGAVLLKQQAEIGEANDLIKDLVASSEEHFASNQQFEALIESIKAGRQLKQLKQSGRATADTRMRVVTSLEQLVYGVRERNRLKGNSGWITEVQFSPNGEIIAAASKDNTVTLWNLQGKKLETFRGDSISFSPNGEMIAASKDNTVTLWNLSGKPLHTIKGNENKVTSASFSPDGQTIASVSEDGSVKLWSKDGTLLSTLKNDSNGVNSISFSPNGQTIVTASQDGTIKLWNLDGALIKTWRWNSSPVESVTFSPDGQVIASADADKTIKLWKSDGTLLQTLRGHSDIVYSVSFSPDGQIITSASDDGTVKLWQRDGILLKTLRGHNDGVTSVSFSPNGKLLAAGSKDSRVILWNFDLDDLLVHACNWVRDYLKNNPNVDERERHLCYGTETQK